MSFLSSIETQFTANFASLATTLSANMAIGAQPVFVVGVTIYILLIGYDVALGQCSDSFAYIFKKFAKIFLFGAFATFAWADYVFPFFANVPAFLSDITTGSPSVATALESNIWTPILRVFISVFNTFISSFDGLSLVTSFWEGGAALVMAVVGLIAGLCLLFVGAAITLVAMIMSVMCTCLLYIVLAIGPVYVMLAAFPATQRYFESWVNSIMTQAVGLLLISVAVQSASALVGLQDFATKSAFPSDGVTYDSSYSLISTIFTKAFEAGILLYLFRKLFDLAASLGGGMNAGGALGHIGRMAIPLPDFQKKPPPDPPPSPRGGSIKGSPQAPHQQPRGSEPQNRPARSHVYNRATQSAISRMK
ncbi:type IV secretion system protein [Curvibacter sp. CHRR-16]|uniref:type IV secretion system protein n=1 Tax=Curvibacter sp. CHRR-16 TaxID=2835872 RepID=UPI001BDAF276|nr:type IV secretion system protein [Curvibacter sp. CHRR-16]MBT0571871.1 type IV secretion system protein [Curvibacter sp. CHRR-16]